VPDQFGCVVSRRWGLEPKSPFLNFKAGGHGFNELRCSIAMCSIGSQAPNHERFKMTTDNMGSGQCDEQLIPVRPPLPDGGQLVDGLTSQVTTTKGAAVSMDDFVRKVQLRANCTRCVDLSGSWQLAIIDGDAQLWSQPPCQGYGIHATRQKQRAFHVRHAVR